MNRLALLYGYDLIQIGDGRGYLDTLHLSDDFSAL